MKKFNYSPLRLIMFLLFFSLVSRSFSQSVGINTTGAAPNAAALLDIDAVGMSPKKGILIPRLTTSERNAISTADGLMIYNSDCHNFNVYNGTAWVDMMGNAITGLPASPATGTHTSTQTQIVWNWNAVSGATGYKWNTTNNYSTATDMLTAVTKTETVSCGTTYTRYVWAYNYCGVSAPTTLTKATISCCNTAITDSRDGKTYNVVLIGAQCWMKDNINVGTLISGSGNQTNNSILEKYCYNNSESNCTTYGGMYQWTEAVQYLNGVTGTSSWSPVPTGNVQGICPTGWHLPSDAEWTQMTDFLGGASVAGGKLKAVTLWNSPNTGADNSSGFTAYPGGNRSTLGTFTTLGTFGNYWTGTEYSSTNGVARYLQHNNAVANSDNTSGKTGDGYSIRCVQD